eukprot:3631573-Rhodomonas_salina.1
MAERQRTSATRASRTPRAAQHTSFSGALLTLAVAENYIGAEFSAPPMNVIPANTGYTSWENPANPITRADEVTGIPTAPSDHW